MPSIQFNDDVPHRLPCGSEPTCPQTAVSRCRRIGEVRGKNIDPCLAEDPEAAAGPCWSSNFLAIIALSLAAPGGSSPSICETSTLWRRQQGAAQRQRRSTSGEPDGRPAPSPEHRRPSREARLEAARREEGRVGSRSSLARHPGAGFKTACGSGRARPCTSIWQYQHPCDCRR